jgi:glycosyltransferase involved in cell wall biosynthesis
LKEPRALKILHCPDLIGGHPYGIAKAERTIGLSSHCIALRPHPFGYPADQILSSGSEISAQLARWRLLGLAMGNYDVIHFNFGQSTMPQRIPEVASSKAGYPAWAKCLYNAYASILEFKDLSLLKRMGKGIVMTYQGDDARQGDFLTSRYKISPADEAGYYTEKSDRFKRERIKIVDRYADAIFALNPDLLHVLPARARFMPYAHLDIAGTQPVPSSSRSVPIVVHAPSHRGVKGTRFVLDAVKRLKSEGIRLEFVLVEGVSHAEAMKLYADADILVDQLLVGWYGGLAVELMALGKPVVAYIREDDMGFIPSAMHADLPVVNATPGSIYNVLRELLTARRHELGAIGVRSRQYVETWHDPIRVASLLKATYVGLIQSEDTHQTTRS